MVSSSVVFFLPSPSFRLSCAVLPTPSLLFDLLCAAFDSLDPRPFLRLLHDGTLHPWEPRPSISTLGLLAHPPLSTLGLWLVRLLSRVPHRVSSLYLCLFIRTLGEKRCHTCNLLGRPAFSSGAFTPPSYPCFVDVYWVLRRRPV